MFFSKILSETHQTGITAPNQTPIYILGTNQLGIFIAARLQQSGQRVILIDSPRHLKEFNSTEIVVREERTLHNHRISFETAYQIQETPQALIITADSNEHRAAISLLPPARMANIPVLNLAFLVDKDLAPTYLNTPVTSGYFNGYLMYDKHQLTILGFQPSIVLSLNEIEERTRLFRSLFNNSGIEIQTNADDSSNFWNCFSPYALSSLLACAFDKNIFHLTKNENDRKLIDKCIEEMIAISKTDGVNQDYAELLRRIYNTPSSYICPLQNSLSRKDYGLLSSIAGILLRHDGAQNKFPQIRAILKQVYDKTLA